MIKLMENYNKALQAIYDHVGFVEDWVVYPIDDRTGMYFILSAESVKYAETIEKMVSDGDYYQDEIYTQRFYEKHIYRGEKLTMVFVDTHTDGNKFFAVFDNAKEIKSEEVHP